MSVGIDDPQALTPGWEQVECFRCEIPGETLYNVGACAVKRCTDCSQAFISPKPGEEMLRDMYDNGYQQDIFRLPEWQFQVIKAVQSVWAEGRLDLVEAIVGEPERPSDDLVVLQDMDEITSMPKMLEIGTPLGMLFLAKARDRGFSIHGHQYSKPIARLVSDGFAALHDGPVENAGFPEAEYDAVCSWDVIEHVPDPSLFLQAIYNTAKPGAAIAISCPNFNSLPQKLFNDRWWTLKPGEHIWHFTPESLGLLFEEAGMPIKRIIKSPFHPANLGRLDSMVALAQKQG